MNPVPSYAGRTNSKFKRGLNGSTRAFDSRRRELARIHCLQKELGLPDSLYRDALWAVARVRSAADLDAGGRARVIAHLAGLVRGQHSQRRPRATGRWSGAVPLPTGAAAEQAIGAYLAPEPRVWGQAPRTLRTRPQLRKIAALLYDGGRPWGYALSLARRIAKKERLELCSDADLAKIIAALAIDQQRRQRRTTGRP